MGFVLKFLIFFLICTVLCSLLWEQLLAGKVYDCVWRVPYLGYWSVKTVLRGKASLKHPKNGFCRFELSLKSILTDYYFTPGDWFHGVEGGDKLQPGWSQQRLWMLWYAMMGASVVASASLASSRKKKRPVP
jgi:hypothetical protein